MMTMKIIKFVFAEADRILNITGAMIFSSVLARITDVTQIVCCTSRFVCITVVSLMRPCNRCDAYCGSRFIVREI